MTNASRHLRRVELALWAIGISLLGVVLGATWDRHHYQAQEERALFEPMKIRAAESIQAPRHTSVADVPGPVGPRLPIDRLRPASAEARATTAPSQRVVDTVKKVERRTDAFEYDSAFGRIEIPRLGVRAIVVDGADEHALARAVGLVPGAAHPGEPGNTVLAGHRDTFFRPLRDIRVNDRIRLRVPPNIYEYRVDETRVVSPDETSVLDSRGVEELTLVTCYPFRFIGPAPDRFIVKATRVN